MESRHVTGDFDHKWCSERVQPAGLSYTSPLLSLWEAPTLKGRWETGWTRGWWSDTEDGPWGSQSPPPICPQAPAKRLIIQTNWTKEITDDRWHNEKVMWFRAENSERERGNKGESTDYPMGSTSPSLHSASRTHGAYPSPGLSQTRLVEFFSAEPEWTHILTFEKTSCCFITLKKHQQLASLSHAQRIRSDFLYLTFNTCA